MWRLLRGQDSKLQSRINIKPGEEIGVRVRIDLAKVKDAEKIPTVGKF